MCCQDNPIFVVTNYDKGLHDAWNSRQYRVLGKDLLYATLLTLYCKKLFLQFEPVTFRSHDSNFIIAPKLPFVATNYDNIYKSLFYHHYYHHLKLGLS